MTQSDRTRQEYSRTRIFPEKELTYAHTRPPGAAAALPEATPVTSLTRSTTAPLPTLLLAATCLQSDFSPCPDHHALLEDGPEAGAEREWGRG